MIPAHSNTSAAVPIYDIVEPPRHHTIIAMSTMIVVLAEVHVLRARQA